MFQTSPFLPAHWKRTLDCCITPVIAAGSASGCSGAAVATDSGVSLSGISNAGAVPNGVSSLYANAGFFASAGNVILRVNDSSFGFPVVSP